MDPAEPSTESHFEDVVPQMVYTHWLHHDPRMWLPAWMCDISCDLHAVAELARMCHAQGSSGVAVTSVLQLAAIVLEKRASAMLH